MAELVFYWDGDNRYKPRTTVTILVTRGAVLYIGGRRSDGKSRFMQKAPAVLLSAPLIVVWTTLAVLAYWRLSPEVSESAKRFVDVQQCVPGELLPPPSLPSRAPFNVTSEVHRPLPCSLVRTHDSSHPQVNPCLHLPSRAPHPLVTCFMVFLHLLMPCVLGASQAGV